MSYEHYLILKKRGDISSFLLNDSGIKVFPVCLNMRKFINKQKNNFIQFNISFEILFDIENYYCIGYDFIRSSHHQSHVSSHYKHIPNLTIKKEPLYEYGNEEEFLPPIASIALCYSEKEIIDFIKLSLLEYEKEQQIRVFESFFKTWKFHKKSVLKNHLNKIDDDKENTLNWYNFYKLCQEHEKYAKI